METPEVKVNSVRPQGTPLHSTGQVLGYLVMLVCVVVFLVHMPALSARAQFQDDQLYVLDNPLVQNPSWASVRRFFTEVFKTSSLTGYYLPLTMTSLMADKALSGGTGSLRVFHRTSLLLHAANAALLTVLLYRLFGNAWIAAGVALLFGMHPLTVDSVCWLSERKTVLATFFALWSLILYVRYSQCEKKWFLAGSTITYVLALLSKPIALPLPAVMLLMDYWPLRRFSRKTVVEKAWLFGLAAVFALITFVSQNSTSGTRMPGQYGLFKIPLIFCHDLIFYLAKMVWPVNVSAHYHHPQPPSLTEPMVVAGVIGTCLLTLVVIYAFRWTPGPLISGLIFTVLLLPAMQIISVTKVLVANRYVYLPSLGVLIGLAAAMVWVLRAFRSRWRTAATWGMAAVMVCLALAESTVTRRYIGCWQDTVSLYKHMLRITPQAAGLYVDMGNTLAREGKSEATIDWYRKALAIEPNFTLAHYNLALALSRSKDGIDEAITHYQRALHNKLTGDQAHVNLAILLRDKGQTDEAIKLMQTALRINPEQFRAHLSLGETLPMVGRSREAIRHLREAIRLSPNLAQAVTDLSWLLATHVDPNIRDPNEAVSLGKRAVYLAGLTDGRTFDALAAAYAANGDFDLAAETAEKAIKTATRLKTNDLADAIRRRLELYKQKKPYFEDPIRQAAEPNAVPDQPCSESDFLAFLEEPQP